MNTQHISSTILEIAERFGIPTIPEQVEPITDEAYAEFCQEYHSWASVRDKALRRHLELNSTLFRTFLPYTPRAFSLAGQVVWYFDEVIIHDPIGADIQIDDLEKSKIKLVENLQLLTQFRTHLDKGYVLLAGESLLETHFDPKDEAVIALLQNERLRDILDRSAKFGLMQQSDDYGKWTTFQIELSLGRYGAGSTQVKQAGHPIPLSPFDIGGVFPEISLEEALPLLPERWRDNLYPVELARLLNSFETARLMGSGVMFDRLLPETLVNELRLLVPSESARLASVDSFKISLPYLEGVSPEKLMDARESTPDGFKEFRSTMYQLVKEASASGKDVSSGEFQSEVDRIVLPQVRSLESELKSLAQRKKLLARGAFAIPGIGVLAGAILGLSPTVLVPLALGGGAGVGIALKEWIDAAAKQTQQESHTFFFVWRAKKN